MPDIYVCHEPEVYHILACLLQRLWFRKPCFGPEVVGPILPLLPYLAKLQKELVANLLMAVDTGYWRAVISYRALCFDVDKQDSMYKSDHLQSTE